MEEDSGTENLPAVFEVPDIPEPGALTEHSSELEARKVDVQIANSQLQLLHSGLTQVRSVTSLCRLVEGISSLVKHRRAILQLPYGTQSQASRVFTVTPLD